MTERSQADSIRIRLKRFFEENWDEDPILAKTISDIINETYDRFKNQLDADVAYFEAMMDIRRRAEDGTIIKYPDGVKSSPELKAYFSLLKHHNVNLSDEQFETVAKKIKNIIGDLARRDWTRPGNSVTDKMEQALLKDVIWPLSEKYNITIDTDTQNQLLLSIIGIAKNHQGR